MIKREFKVNLKSFIIWSSILVGMFLFVYLIYPYIITDENVASMDELMKAFPPEVLKAFNMDMSSLTTAYGWMKTEGVMFILLIIGFYSSFLGGNIVLKEENDKTIEYLSFLPIKRSKIISNKILVAVIYIISIVLLLGIFNYIALKVSGDVDSKQLILLSISPILIGLPLFAINLFVSTFLHKTKKVVGISLGMVFIFYLISVLSELSTNVEFLKYFSIYTLADTRNIIANTELNFISVLVSLVITVIFIFLTYLRYNKKELI